MGPDVDAAQDVFRCLPTWFGWLRPLVYIPATIFLSWLVSRLAVGFALRPWKQNPDVHWTEKTRLGLPARLVLKWTTLILVAVFVALYSQMLPELVRIPYGLWLTMAGLACVVGCLLNYGPLKSRLMGRPYGIVQRLRVTVALRVLLGGFPLLELALVGFIMPQQFDSWACFLVVAITIYSLIWVLGGHFIASRWIGVLRPASDRARAITARAAQRVGVSPSAVYEISIDHANALAFPQQRAVAYTSKLLEILDDEQVEAICTHELGHLADPRYTRLKWMYVVFAVLVLPLVVLKPLFWQFGMTWVVYALIGYLFVFVLVGRIMRRIRQRGEEHADRVGTEHESESGLYAAALECVYRENLSPLAHLSSHGHPQLYDRLVASGIEPDYERPKPHSQLRVVIPLVVVLLLAVCGFTALHIATSVGVARAKTESTKLIWLALVGAASSEPIAELAEFRLEQGKTSDAVAMYEFVCEEHYYSPYYLTRLAVALVADGNCQRARDVLDQAQILLTEFGDGHYAQESYEQCVEYFELSCGVPEPLP